MNGVGTTQMCHMIGADLPLLPGLLPVPVGDKPTRRVVRYRQPSGMLTEMTADAYSWDDELVANLVSRLDLPSDSTAYACVLFLAWRICTGLIRSCEPGDDTPTADRCERYVRSKDVIIPVTFIR
jgi:hypothetical protein